MTTLTRTETAKLLLRADRVLILSHRRPDGDTTGSAAALCLGLRQLGKQAWVLENREVTPRLHWLHEGLTKAQAEGEDFVVSVDVASPNMLPETFRPLLDRIALRIDHHSAAISFTPQELVDPDSASCAEIVWDVLLEMGVRPDTSIAAAVYVGLSTDTGCFRYSNTNAHTFATAAGCAATGLDVYRLNQELFEVNTLGKLRMWGWIVDHIKLLPGDMAVCAIPAAVERELGVTEDDMENISSFPRSIEGVKMAATLREVQEGAKLSVRSIPGLDATVVAGAFGGGGHKAAAGASIAMPLEQAAQAVEQVMLRMGPWTES